ncbi:hypothetical protein VNI00_004248 [Paramarasmius palmivorus]|uniref:AB hydrolase-1 domain-containing protein n=1 Tax=Paramarasmius palmivorus TaxID=297713 RepID=A0AAW0DL32_9AGAR
MAAVLDKSFYKDFQVSRSFIYHYYTTPAIDSQPVLVFIHGFGVASQDWRHQVRFFQGLGYGIIAPDSLGYGGSSTITDPDQLKLSSVAKDFVELLQHEGIEKAIFIGQGGGCPVISRIAQLFPDVVVAAAFLAIPYSAPTPPPFDLDQVLKTQKEVFGYELFGYWGFIGKDPDAPAVVSANFEAFFNVIYPEDPRAWITHFGPSGMLRKHLLSGETLPTPSWFASEEREFQYNTLKTFDLSGPFTYYRAYLENVQSLDGESVPRHSYSMTKPVFFGGGTEDYISLPSVGKQTTVLLCDNSKITIRDFKATHWMHLQVPDEVNKELLEWIQCL